MKLPQLGEQVESGIVLSVLVAEGDRVEEDQTVLELETDKATTEVPAEQSGVVEKIHVSEGDEIRSGDPILTFGDEAEGEEGEEAEPSEPEPEEAEKPERVEEPEEEREKKEKEEEEEERGAESSGRAEAAEAEEGKTEEEPATKEEEETRKDRSPARPEQAREEPEAPSAQPRLDSPAPAAPSVRRMARKLGVEVSEVPGSGPGGRISEEDVISHVRSIVEEARDSKEPEREKLPDFSRWGDVAREPMNAIRRATAENVSRSWEKIPHVTQYDRADITDLEEFRADWAERAEEAGGKLTVTAILVKIAAEALRKFPHFNASIDVAAGEYVMKDYVHVSVAVDTDEGLLMPVLRDADEKGLLETAAELTEAAKKARDRKLSMEEMEGGTFSVTNLGGLGTTSFTPIVGWPQVAILSVGRASTQPVWQEGEFVPRTILPLGITYDHRAVDGADAARFLRWIAEVLEEPMRLTMSE